ncbi:MAG: hypothetical protein ACLFRP_09300 [Puniceicoccaceae bacterium]
MLFDILFILIFTLILVALLVPVGGYRTYRDRFDGRRFPAEEEPADPADVGVGAGVGLTMLFFFLILFPLILAGSVWVGPRGPLFMGVSWLPIVAIGVILVLLLAAVLPRESRTGRTRGEEEDLRRTAAGIFGLFFFLLLIVAVTLIVVAYI